jgi:hypothetical protein
MAGGSGKVELQCVECGCAWRSEKERWRAVRVDLPDEDVEPRLAFYCAVCSLVHFGGPSWPHAEHDS